MRLLLVLGLFAAICLAVGNAAPHPSKKVAPVLIKKQPVKIIPVKSIKRREASAEPDDKGSLPLPGPVKKILPKLLPKLIKKREADAEPDMKKHLPPLRPPIKQDLPKTPALQPLKISKEPVKKKAVEIKKIVPKKVIKKREADALPDKKKKHLPPLRPPIKQDLPKTPPLQPLKISKEPIKKKVVEIKKIVPEKVIKKREANALPDKKKPLPPLRPAIKQDLPKTPPLQPLKVSKEPVKKKLVKVIKKREADPDLLTKHKQPKILVKVQEKKKPTKC